MAPGRLPHRADRLGAGSLLSRVSSGPRYCAPPTPKGGSTWRLGFDGRKICPMPRSRQERVAARRLHVMWRPKLRSQIGSLQLFLAIAIVTTLQHARARMSHAFCQRPGSRPATSRTGMKAAIRSNNSCRGSTVHRSVLFTPDLNLPISDSRSPSRMATVSLSISAMTLRFLSWLKARLTVSMVRPR